MPGLMAAASMLPVLCPCRPGRHLLATPSFVPSRPALFRGRSIVRETFAQRASMRSSLQPPARFPHSPLDQHASFRGLSPRGGVPGTFLRTAVELPPIDGDLIEVLEEWGADVDSNGVALSFGNDNSALEAAYEGVVMYNMTHFGRIRVSGDDRLRFLHNMTSADIQSLQPGQGCFTVFQTAQARTLDLAQAWVMSKAVILTVSPSMKGSLISMMDRYLFPADKVELADISDKTCQLSIIGPASTQALERLGIQGLEGEPMGTHRHFSVDGSPATVTVGSGLSLPGYTLLLAADVAGPVWSTLAEAGVVPMGEAAWNRLRVLEGRPAPGAELTKDFNPLEAGLGVAISTSKGCYMGQETVARLITYDGVKQHLWGVAFEGEVPTPGPLQDGQGKKIGVITSCVANREAQQEPFVALAYVKRSEGTADGAEVLSEGNIKGFLRRVPFTTLHQVAT